MQRRSSASRDRAQRRQAKETTRQFVAKNIGAHAMQLCRTTFDYRQSKSVYISSSTNSMQQKGCGRALAEGIMEFGNLKLSEAWVTVPDRLSSDKTST
jgi:hypothetical protein